MIATNQAVRAVSTPRDGTPPAPQQTHDQSSHGEGPPQGAQLHHHPDRAGHGVGRVVEPAAEHIDLDLGDRGAAGDHPENERDEARQCPRRAVFGRSWGRGSG